MKIFPRILLCAVALLAAAYGQATITLTPSATVVYPGESLTIELALGGNTTPASIQWSAPLPGLVTTADAEATAAAKTVQCATVSGATNCVVSGLNKNKVADGPLATITVPTTAPGKVNFVLTGLLGSTDAGNPITITAAATSYTINEAPTINRKLSGRAGISGSATIR